MLITTILLLLGLAAAGESAHTSCSPHCGDKGVCLNYRCICRVGWGGVGCREPIANRADEDRMGGPICVPSCANGGMCRDGACVCKLPWAGPYCQYRAKKNLFCGFGQTSLSASFVCPDDTVIKVDSTIFGMHDETECDFGIVIKYPRCFSLDESLNRVRNLCDGRKYCDIDAHEFDEENGALYCNKWWVRYFWAVYHCEPNNPITVGVWNRWSRWTECTASCDVGWQTRERTCSQPHKHCYGDLFETQACNRQLCPTKHYWSAWDEWSACSTSCGVGERKRYRLCDNGRARFVQHCSGNDVDSEYCNIVPCEPAVWSGWTSWTSCSVTCGVGTRKRGRICLNTKAKLAAPCPGNDYEKVTCVMPACAKPTWSDWSEWTSCSESCDLGIQKRYRSCINTPALFISLCDGVSTETKQCLRSKCPLVEWSTWSQWYDCSVSCGDGTRRRYRNCGTENALYTRAFYSPCPGEAVETSKCTKICIDNNLWGSWSFWSTCSNSCGVGTQKRKRQCASVFVNTCEGRAEETRSCRTDCVDDPWRPWSDWSTCSCSGVRRRIRECASVFGVDCFGVSQQSEECKPDVNCGRTESWNEWTQWSECTAFRCNQVGTKFRERRCKSIFGLLLNCDGDSLQTVNCSAENLLCASEPSDSWSEWSSCSTSCGTGVMKRERICGAVLGPECLADATDVKECTTECGEDMLWSEWSEWSACTETCFGIKQKQRNCVSGECPESFITQIERCENSPGCEEIVFPTTISNQPTIMTTQSSQTTVKQSHNTSLSTIDEQSTSKSSATSGTTLETTTEESPTTSTTTEESPTTSTTTEESHTTSTTTISTTTGIVYTWGEWEACSLVCGGGERRRLAICDPLTMDCYQPIFEVEPCNEFPCNRG